MGHGYTYTPGTEDRPGGRVLLGGACSDAIRLHMQAYPSSLFPSPLLPFSVESHSVPLTEE